MLPTYSPTPLSKLQKRQLFLVLGKLEHGRHLGNGHVIERAKGILMQAKNLSEENAYALLRKTAMNENKKIAEVAQSVITAAELFK